MHPSGGRDAGRAVARAVVLLVAIGCSIDDGVRPGPPPPVVVASAVTANPDNVLAAVVTARARFADSVAVGYGLAGAALDSATPAVTTLADSAAVPLFGLAPETRYTLRVVAYGGGQVAGGDTLTLTTGALPAELPRYVASGSDPSPGYVVFAAALYGLVIDNTGRVVWYHRFLNGPGLNFEAEPTGRYYARPPTPDRTDLEPWVEIDPLGNVTRTFGCAGGLQPRFHDLIAELDGSYWVMCDEMRTMDLSGLGGVANAQVMGTVVQHISSAGELLFRWSPFDHFDITDLDPASRTGANVNWTHGNSLDLDSDGNLAFSFQHGVRLTAPDHLLLLDNLGDPSGSRAERYEYDAPLRTARQTGSYGSSPAVTAALGGSTQDLPGGRTLVSFGPAGRVEEYDASGQVVWRIEGNAGYVFRAQRIRSLYRPGVGSPR